MICCGSVLSMACYEWHRSQSSHPCRSNRKQTCELYIEFALCISMSILHASEYCECLVCCWEVMFGNSECQGWVRSKLCRHIKCMYAFKLSYMYLELVLIEIAIRVLRCPDPEHLSETPTPTVPICRWKLLMTLRYAYNNFIIVDRKRLLSPAKRRDIVLDLSVCPSVRPSVRPSRSFFDFVRL